MTRNRIFMSLGLAALVLGLTLTMLWYNMSRQSEPQASAEYVSNEIIVKFRQGMIPREKVVTSEGYLKTGLRSIDGLNVKYHIDMIETLLDNPDEYEKEYGLDRCYLLKSTKNFDVLNAVREYNADPNVEHAEPNSIRKLD